MPRLDKDKDAGFGQPGRPGSTHRRLLPYQCRNVPVRPDELHDKEDRRLPKRSRPCCAMLLDRLERAEHLREVVDDSARQNRGRR